MEKGRRCPRAVTMTDNAIELQSLRFSTKRALQFFTKTKLNKEFPVGAPKSVMESLVFFVKRARYSINFSEFQSNLSLPGNNSPVFDSVFAEGRSERSATQF